MVMALGAAVAAAMVTMEIISTLTVSTSIAVPPSPPP